MVLRGEVEDVQLGAFLMLLRVKEETAEELAGFVQACRDYLGPPPSMDTQLDWSSYAGKRNQHLWYLLSALLLAGNGVRVFMHGTDGHTPARAYAQETLRGLGIEAADSFEDAGLRMGRECFTYMPLQTLLPPLHDIVQLKPTLGLRSPVNTLARMLNPTRAPCSIQSVFHPNYAALHIGADVILDQPHSLVFKGEAGEVEIKPHARTECHLQRNGQGQQLTWPRQLQGKPEGVERPSAAALRSLWRGESTNRYGELAVTETAAAALLLMDPALDVQSSRELSQQWWVDRDRSRF